MHEGKKVQRWIKTQVTGLIQIKVVFIWTLFQSKSYLLCPEIRDSFTSSIHTSIWLVLWALAKCILASAACRIKTCKLWVFLQSAAKSKQKAWPHSLSLLFCPWLTQSQSVRVESSPVLNHDCCWLHCAGELAFPFPIAFLYQYPVTHTQCRAKALVGFVNPYRGPLFRTHLFLPISLPPSSPFLPLQWRV